VSTSDGCAVIAAIAALFAATSAVAIGAFVKSAAMTFPEGIVGQYQYGLPTPGVFLTMYASTPVAVVRDTNVSAPFTIMLQISLPMNFLRCFKLRF
jgi:hypothetical protein